MKKLTAVLLALVLALTICCSALAEEPAAAEINQQNWLTETLTTTDWIEKDGRATLDVEPLLDPTDDSGCTFIARLYGPNSAFDGVEYELYCVYDPDIHSLLAKEVICRSLTYGEDGEIDAEEEVYDKPSQAIIELGEDGLLTVKDPENEDLAAIGFEPLPAAVEKAAPLTDEQAAVVAKTLEGLLGVNYEPVCVIAEADYMLCVLCQATVVYPGAEPQLVLMVINNSDPESPVPEFIQIAENDASEG